MPTNAIDLCSEALAYARRGILIFPLWHVGAHIGGNICACSDGPDCGSPGKHPRTRNGLNEASADLRVVEQWWQRWPHAGIGMPMGANQLAAIDIDPDHGANPTVAILEKYCDAHGVNMWCTRVNLTGSGGYHVIYRDRHGVVPTKRQTFGPDAPGVDTRGRGGYIVAPPSMHVSGRRYEIIDTGYPLADWPACLTPLLEPVRPEQAPPAPVLIAPAGLSAQSRGAVWAKQALEAECQKLIDLHGAPAGSGKNDQLNIAAYKIGRRVGAGYLNENEAADLLYAACSRWPGHTERELRATIRSGMRAGIAKPHPGPATRGGGAR